ncbi:MAG: hypothetical protein H0W11_07265 [Gemmatimonadetes bacterium]|nr:hypothetical protein [Gemmatimonadota bacterium]
MAEVLVQFTRPVVGSSGQAYLPRACGRLREDGLWEGWIEFVSDDGSPVLRSPRETVQSDRVDLRYWATGLTRAHLEGSLRRALDPVRPRPTANPTPAYDAPAPSPAFTGATAVPPHPTVRILPNPFEAYARGEEALRRQLHSPDAAYLRELIRTYGLLDNPSIDLWRMSKAALVGLALVAVRERLR